MDNVIDIRLWKKEETTEEEVAEEKDAYEIFKEALERNKKRKKKLSRERADSNDSVLRSYRIKK